MTIKKCIFKIPVYYFSFMFPSVHQQNLFLQMSGRMYNENSTFLQMSGQRLCSKYIWRIKKTIWIKKQHKTQIWVLQPNKPPPTQTNDVNANATTNKICIKWRRRHKIKHHLMPRISLCLQSCEQVTSTHFNFHILVK